AAVAATAVTAAVAPATASAASAEVGSVRTARQRHHQDHTVHRIYLPLLKQPIQPTCAESPLHASSCLSEAGNNNAHGQEENRNGGTMPLSGASGSQLVRPSSRPPRNPELGDMGRAAPNESNGWAE